MATTYENKVMVYDGGKLKKIAVDDTLVFGNPLGDKVTINAAAGTVAAKSISATSGASFGGTVSITGDLVVSGDITSTTASSLIVGDSFIDLNAGNNTAAEIAGGMSVTVEGIGSPLVQANASAFYASVNTLSDPYIVVDDASAFNALGGELVLVTGTNNGKNDGQYVIQFTDTTPGANKIYVKGNPSSPDPVDLAKTPFAHNQFEEQTGLTTAKVTVARFAVMAASNGLMQSGAGAIPAGTWCWASGYLESSFATWTSLASATAPTLQSVYATGATASIALTNGRTFSITPPGGGGESAGFSFIGNAASTIGANNSDLTIGSTATRIDLNGKVRLPSDAGSFLSSRTLAAGTVAGQVCYINASAQAEKTGSGSEHRVYGVAVGTVSNWSNTVMSTRGQPVVVKYAGTPPVVGDELYLSVTAGSVQVGAPDGGRIYFIGTCTVAGAANECTMNFDPQYIADLPAVP